VDLAPKGDRAPEALFKMGLAYRSLRRPERAREVWSQLLRDFPQSEAAQKARLAMREVARPTRGGSAATGTTTSESR
jgi:TolA-binding protein